MKNVLSQKQNNTQKSNQTTWNIYIYTFDIPGLVEIFNSAVFIVTAWRDFHSESKICYVYS